MDFFLIYTQINVQHGALNDLKSENYLIEEFTLAFLLLCQKHYFYVQDGITPLSMDGTKLLNEIFRHFHLKKKNSAISGVSILKCDTFVDEAALLDSAVQKLLNGIPQIPTITIV